MFFIHAIQQGLDCDEHESEISTL